MEVKMYAELKQKKCIQCEEKKELIEFRKRFRGKNKNIYFESYCKNCERLNTKSWSQENKERRKEITLKKDLKRNFDLSLEDYYKMRKEHNNQCAVCKVSKSKSGRRLAVDHCHNTKLIRGLLCNECNTALGLLGENVERMYKLIEYISKFKK